MAESAPTFESTVEVAPDFDSTSPVDSIPSFDETVEVTEEKQPFADVASRVVTSAAQGVLNTASMATRLTALTPAGALKDWVNKKMGTGNTSDEVVTEITGASDRAGEEYGVDPQFNNTLLSAVASGAGQIATILPTGPAAPFVAAAQAGESGLREAEAAGATGTQKVLAAAGNAATAFVTEKLLGVPAMLKSFQASKIPLTGLKSRIESVLLQAGKGFFREGTQETTEQVIQDFIAKGLYDPEREVFNADRLLKVGLAGGIVGGGVGGAGQAIYDIAPKQEMQKVAETVDQTLAETAVAEPPPLVEPVAPPVTQPPLPTPSEPVQSVPTPTLEQENATQEGIVQEGSQPEYTETPQGGLPTEPSGRNLPVESTEEALTDEQAAVANEAAVALQPLLNRATEAARQRGAVDPELAASTAMTSLSNEVGRGEKTIEEATEDFVAAARNVALNQRAAENTQKRGGGQVVSTEEQVVEPAVTRGPRAAQVSREDMDSIYSAVESLPENQRNVMRALEEDPELTDAQIATQVGLTLDQVKKAKSAARASLKKFIQEKGIGANLGPGAANIEEVLVQYEKRRFSERFQQAEDIDPELRRQTGNRYYEPIPHQVKLDEANNLIAERGADDVAREIRDETNSLPFDTRVMVGQLLVKQYNKEYQEKKGTKEGEDALDKSVELAEWVAEYGTRLGQGISRFAVWFNLSAEGKLRAYQKKATKIQQDYTRNNRGDIDQIKDIVNDEAPVEPQVKSLLDRIIEKLRAPAQAARERLLARLQRTSTLLDPTILYDVSVVGAYQIAKGIKKLSDWKSAMRQELDGQFEEYYDEAFKEASKRVDEAVDQTVKPPERKRVKSAIKTSNRSSKIERLSKLKSPTARKVRKRLDRIVDAAKDGKLTDEKFYEVSADALGLPVFSDQVAREIMRLGLEIDNAPEGMPRLEKTLALHKYIAQQKGFPPSDLLFGVYYGNILAGGWTQFINLADTSLNVLNEVATLAIQSGSPRGTAQIASGLAKGLSMGRFDALMAIMKGRRISDGKFVEDPFFMEVAEFGKKGGVPIQTDTALRRGIKAITESPAGKYLNAYKYVGRFMSASDALAFRAAQEAKAAQLAWRMANETGVDTDSILGYDRIPEFEKQAESEGYTRYQKQARVTELMLMSRPAELQKAATDFASEATYNVKPYGLMGALSSGIESITRRYKVGKLVVPFTRIVANVVNRGLNNSPYGYVNAIRGKSGDRVFTPEERNAMLIRATGATALMAVLVALHESGALTIHGAGPSDPEKKKQLRQTGWKPYTIQIGDDYYSYTYTPWGLMMAATGNWMDNEKYKDFSSKDGLDRFTYSVQSVASTVFNQSFLSGLSTLFDIIAGKSPAMQIKATQRFITNTVTGLTIPFASALKDLEAITSSPNVPKIENVRQAIIASIPFASQLLKPQLNALGEPVKSVRNRLYSTNKDDVIWKLVAEKDLRLPVPNTFFEDPEKQYDYHKEQGQALKKWLTANIDRLNSMDRENAQNMIERASDTFREKIRIKIMREGAKRKPKKSTQGPASNG